MMAKPGATSASFMGEKKASRHTERAGGRPSGSGPRMVENAPVRVLEAAGMEFAQKGYEGTSFREIAAAAGVSYSLIAYHYGSKEELWRSTVAYFSEKGARALDAAEEEMPASRQAFDEWLRRFLHTGLLIAFEGPVLYRMAMHEALSNREGEHDRLLRMVSRGLYKGVARLFSGARASIKQLSLIEAQFMFRAMINMHTVAPYELELITGCDPSTGSAVDYQVELLVSIFYRGKGVAQRSRGVAAARESFKTVSVGQPPGAGAPLRPLATEPRSVRGQKARENLIEAALIHFARYGFDGASVRKIANDAKVAYPLVIYHFGSKEMLWEAAIEQVFLGRIERLRKIFREVRVETSGDLGQLLFQLLMEASARPELRKIFVLELFAGTRRYDEKLKPMAAEFVNLIGELSSDLVTKRIVTRFSQMDVQLLIVACLLCHSVLPDAAHAAFGVRGPEQSARRISEFLASVLIRGRGLATH
jgi:TetR/AcrR family transcriptional regulator